MNNTSESNDVSGIFTRLAVERNPDIAFFKTKKGEQWFTSALSMASQTSILSVSNLSIKPTYWFILVDSTLAAKMKVKAIQTFSTSTTIETRLIEVDGWANSASAIAMDSFAMNCTVQVRLDYDDLLNKNYFRAIFDAVKNRPVVISPILGVSHNVSPTRLAIIRKMLPPFLCLFRFGVNDPQNIFSLDHDKWPESMILILDKNPLWMQTITGKNIANSYAHGWMVNKVRYIKQIDLYDWTGQPRKLISKERHLFFQNLREILREMSSLLKRFSKAHVAKVDNTEN